MKYILLIYGDERVWASMSKDEMEKIYADHRAYGDARATAEVFRRMLDRADEQSIVGWNELQKVLYARAARRKRRSTPTSFDPLA